MVGHSNVIHKREDGKEVIRVYVSKKIDAKKLATKDLIQKKVRIGFKQYDTDVIEIGEVNAQSLIAKVRPVKRGYSIGHYKVTAGTAGIVCYVDGKPFIITNCHVGANSTSKQLQRAYVGDPILQPAAYDNGLFSLVDSGDCVGTLAAFIPLDEQNPNIVDVALIKPFVDSNVEYVVVNGVEENCIEGMQGVYDGRTSGNKPITVIDTSATIYVNYGSFVAVFNDQVIFTPPSIGGDSGSVIRTLDEKAWLLVFAGSQTVGIANKFTNVISEFAKVGINIEFIPPAPPAPPKLQVNSFKVQNNIGVETDIIQRGTFFNIIAQIQNIGGYFSGGTQTLLVQSPYGRVFYLNEEPLDLAPQAISTKIYSMMMPPNEELGLWVIQYMVMINGAPLLYRSILLNVV